MGRNVGGGECVGQDGPIKRFSFAGIDFKIGQVAEGIEFGQWGREIRAWPSYIKQEIICVEG